MNSLLGHLQQDLQEFTARVKRDLGDDYTDEERNKRFKLSVNDALEEFLKKDRQIVSEIPNTPLLSSLLFGLQYSRIVNIPLTCNNNKQTFMYMCKCASGALFLLT